MNFKQKLNSIKTSLKNTGESLQDTNLDDLTKIYRKLLRKLPDISHLKNIVLFSGVATLLIFVLFAQRFSTLYEYLPTAPAEGGVYSGGVVGELTQFNPLFAPTNPAETSAVSLLYSGLTKRTNNWEVEGDLAERWEISEDKLTYTFYLRDGIFWHDGEPLDADDVVFTINTIQNPDVGTSRLTTWKDVEVSASGPKTVVFKLPNVYASFIYLTDVPIIPQHILADISADNLRAAEFSIEPVGSGPFLFQEFRELKDTQEIHLLVNEDYYGKVPYIGEVILKAYPTYADLTHAYARKEVMGIERLLPSEMVKKDQLPNLRVYNLGIPEYDVVFMNMAAKALEDKNLRKAIALAIDKDRIIQEVYYGQAVRINSPILPGLLGYNKDVKQTFDLAAAKKTLKDGKYTLSEGVLKKGKEEISLRLVANEGPLKNKEADLVQEMLGEIGIAVTVERYPFNTFVEDYVRPRNYDLLLVSQNMGADSDIYSFYHSNLAEDPGLNFSGISSREIDKYLEDARTTHDQKERAARYQDAVKLIVDAYPAVYLARPNYLYGVSGEVKGINLRRVVEPKDRFWDISSWYLNEELDY